MTTLPEGSPVELPAELPISPADAEPSSDVPVHWIFAVSSDEEEAEEEKSTDVPSSSSNPTPSTASGAGMSTYEISKQLQRLGLPYKVSET